MEFNTQEIALVKQAEIATQDVTELDQLQLAMIGGGDAAVVFG